MAEALSTVFALGMWGRRDGWPWGSSRVFSEHGVLPYFLAPRSGTADHPCALQAGDGSGGGGTRQVWCEGSVGQRSALIPVLLFDPP